MEYKVPNYYGYYISTEIIIIIPSWHAIARAMAY